MRASSPRPHTGIFVDQPRRTDARARLDFRGAQDAAGGALPSIHAATAADVEPTDYFGPGGIMALRGAPKKVGAPEQAHDKDVASRLWDTSESLTGARVVWS